MAPITHNRGPDAPMPRCRNLYAFLGKQCLADQTQDHTPSPQASQQQQLLGKRIQITPDGVSVADPSTFISQISILRLLSRPFSKDHPVEQSLENGVQVLTAGAQGNNVQIRVDNPQVAFPGRATVLDASLSEDSPLVEAVRSRNRPEQRVMAGYLESLHKQSHGGEVAELGSVQSTPVNSASKLDNHQLIDASDASLLESTENDSKEISIGPDKLCSFKLRGSQDEALVLKLQDSESSSPNEDLCVMDHGHLHRTFEVAETHAFEDHPVEPSIDQKEQAEPHSKQQFSSSLQSQVQERSGHIFGTCHELCTINSNSDELQSVVCATMLQCDGNKAAHCAGKPDTNTAETDMFSSSTAQKQEQGCKVDMSSLTCREHTQGQNVEVDLRRSSRIKMLVSSGDEDSFVLPTDCYKNKQVHFKSVASSSLHENVPKLTQSDFFLPASKRSKKQKVLEETIIQVSDKPALQEKRPREEKAVLAQKGTAGISCKQSSNNDEFFKPASKKQKQIVNMAKEGRGEQTSIFEFDLWTEAKIAAEENAQLCVGKPTHPFFSQHKNGQRASVFAALPVNPCSFQQASSVDEIELIPSPPFHITQLLEAEIHTKDKESCAPSWICPKLKEDLVSSMRKRFDENKQKLDALLRIPMVKKLSKAPRQRRDDPYGGLSLDKVLEPLLMFLKDVESDSKEIMDQDVTDFSFAYLEDRLKVCLSERAKRCSEGSSDTLSAFADEANTQKNMLWTDVYQPQSPKQVCGNRDSVNTLSAWLEKWQAGGPFTTGSAERDATCRKICTNENSDDDQDCFQEDPDCEGNKKEDVFSQNVLFLAGPVGCGKTAAIYACARAHGYTVIEVNCSENRNGLLIKQKFSESMESHRLGNKWSADNTGPGTVSSCATGDTLVAAGTNEAENAQQTGNQKRQNKNQKHKPKNDRTTTSKLTNNKAVYNTDGGSDSQAEQHDGSKDSDKSLTVLLFEDVDMVFEDDRGFLAAVAQLAATAKRPIILTSNDKQLCLPQKLGADLLEFKKPSTKELVILTYLICVAEDIPCRPEILLQMVKLCHNDLRLLLNHLQFWCQGRDSESSFELEDVKPSLMLERELKMQSPEAESAATRKLFELEAQHRLWPLFVSMDFACPLTHSVAGELNKKVLQLEREVDLEEQKKLEDLVLERLALIKKMKRQKLYSRQRAEREGASSDVTESTIEDSDKWETPVKNLKDVKAVARSPMLRDKLKKDLATTMFDSAANVDPSDENHRPVLMTPDFGEGDLSITPLAGTDILGGTISIIAPSLTTGETVRSPALESNEQQVQREPLMNDTDIKTRLMAQNVLMKASNDTCSTNIEPGENLRCNLGDSKLQRVSASVNSFWSEFRDMKGKRGLLLSSSSKQSYSTILSVSKLLEDLSFCDSMSCSLDTEKMVPENLSYLSSCCESLENSNMLQACSMVAQKSLLLCADGCPASSNTQEGGKTMLSIDDMMLAVNDPCALSRLVSSGELQPTSRGFELHNVAPSSQEQDFKRHVKLSSLHRALHRELPSKMQLSLQRASFFEDASFLARIGLLEQERLNSGGTRRRGRGFHNYFRTHPWNLSKETINIIEKFGKFGNSSTADS